MKKHAIALLLSMLVAFAFVPFCVKLVAKAETTLFSDGFESGTFLTTDSPAGAWRNMAIGAGCTASISTTYPIRGSYDAEFIVAPGGVVGLPSMSAGGWWCCCKAPFTATATAFMRAYYTFSTLPQTGEYVVLNQLRANMNYAVAVLLANVSGSMFWGLDVIEGAIDHNVYEAVASNATTGVPYCIEIKRDVANGLEQLWVDGVSKVTDNLSITNNCAEILAGYDEYVGGTQQTCYVDCVVVADAYIGPLADVTPPTFGNISASTTIAGQSCSFNCLVSDDTNVSSYIFSTNNTGSWINDTEVAFSNFYNSTAAWANVTKTLDDTVGDVVSYMWFANDTSNNWGSSDQYNLTVTAPLTISIVSPENTTYTTANVSLNFTINEAASWMGYSLDGQGNVTISGNTTLTGLSNGPHQVIVYANDTVGNMGSSQTVYFTVETTGQITFNQIGINSDFTGTVVTIDGTNYTVTDLPQTFTWDVGSEHTFSFASPLAVNAGKQYIWSNTTGLSTLQSDTITVSPASGSVTASYRTQYYLTVSSPYGTSGGSGWYAAGATAYATLTTGTVDQLNQTRRVFTDWSGDASGTSYAQSNPITMDAARTAVANWKTQYQVTFTVAPSGQGTTSPAGTDWYDAGPPGVAISATASGISYKFTSWSTTDNISFANQFSASTVATISGPGTITANFALNTEQITIDSNPDGPGFINVDGTNYTTPQTFTWTVGNTHTLEAFSPVPGPAGTRYVFANWSDSGSQTHLFAVPASSDTVTANYNTQFQVTFSQTGIGADFTGTVVTIDGANYSLTNLPGSFWWANGSTHAFAFQSPLVVNATTQYNWTSTSGLSTLQSATLSITKPGSITGNYVVENENHPDIAVTSVVCPKTVVGRGYSTSINVTVKNLGNVAETFNLTVYADPLYITSQNVTLSSGNSTTVTFIWNTTGFAYFNYTLSAYAWPVPGETNIANNNCTGGWVIVSIPGDVTGPNGVPDGKVDIRDVHYVAMYYGTTPSSPNWNPNADINNDGKIDIKDVHIAALHYGQHYP